MQLNVLHLIDSFQQGGTERQAVQLVRLLNEAGRYRPHLACLNPDGLLRPAAEALGLPPIPAYPLTSFYDRNAVVQLRRFARVLRERDIKVIHAHDFYTNVFGMAAAALARVPARVASKRETDFRGPGQKRLERAAFRLAHGIVTNADAVRRRLIKEGVRAAKCVTIYNGLDMARVAPPADFKRADALALFKLPAAESARRFVTIVANVQHEVKDHPMFLRAARRVRAAVADAAFIIAGEGQLQASLRAYAAELGLTQDVFFTGRCERVAELLALSDVCVLSSRAEGFSNAILEYMAAARPVVATDVGGAREAIIEGETGHIVAAGDDEALADRIVALLREPERARRMGVRAQQIVAEKFSCAAQLARTEELYDQLLARAGQRAAG